MPASSTGMIPEQIDSARQPHLVMLDGSSNVNLFSNADVPLQLSSAHLCRDSPPLSVANVPGYMTEGDDVLQRLHRASRPYHGVLTFATGLVATFYGRSFPYSILFGHCFPTIGWPLLHPALLGIAQRVQMARLATEAELPELREARGAASQALRRLAAVRDAYFEAEAQHDSARAQRLALELAELQEEVQAVTRASSSFGAILRAARPEPRLPSRPLSLHLASASAHRAGLVATMESATSLGSAKLGFACDLGGAVVDTMRSWTAPFLQRPLQEIAQAGLGAWYAEPEVRSWTDFVINALCSSIGIAVAMKFERLVFTVSNAVIGAELLMAPLLRKMEVHGVVSGPAEQSYPVQLVKYSICTVGVLHQFLGKCRSLPGILRVALWCPLILERWLGGLASVTRSGRGVTLPITRRRPEDAGEGDIL
ncbi:hypothetical protein AB1Y20_003812 [Prymnesium parvum]|uniref:Uncharacterized protein n=1 Tax=Prymnesium parvum TaxID=97485 RepID=A0AB34J8C9_PRYPA